MNDDLVKQWDLGEVRERTFRGAGDAEVQMYLVLPPGYEPGKKYPLVHLVHGGPVGTFGDGFNFRWNAQAFAAPGYVVAMVNFHGSSSFGQPFVESILGAHPDKPFTDVMRATDLLVAEGVVDPSRMAAAGGSYGGFLVNWIAGHTDRFRALVSHAGVYSLLGQFASDSTHGRHHSYGGYPYTNRDGIEKWSPNRYASGFVTPMLILHGERDFRVPVDPGSRALRDPHGEGGAGAARLLPRREPLDPEGRQLEALVRRGAGVARALARRRVLNTRGSRYPSAGRAVREGPQRSEEEG